MKTSPTPTPAPVDEPPRGDTAARLLDAAQKLFADHGYAGASIREITQLAGSNIAAVNYHFGDKLGLYVAVLQRRLRQMRDVRLARIHAVTTRPAYTLEEVVEVFATAFLEPVVEASEGRATMSLLMREMLDPQAPPGMLAREMIEPMLEIMTPALIRAAPGLDAPAAQLCLFSLVGQLVQALQIHRLAEHDALNGQVMPGGMGDLTLMTRHAVRFTVAGIRGLTPVDENKA